MVSFKFDDNIPDRVDKQLPKSSRNLSEASANQAAIRPPEHCIVKIRMRFEKANIGERHFSDLRVIAPSVLRALPGKPDLHFRLKRALGIQSSNLELLLIAWNPD